MNENLRKYGKNIKFTPEREWVYSNEQSNFTQKWNNKFILFHIGVASIIIMGNKYDTFTVQLLGQHDALVLSM